MKKKSTPFRILLTFALLLAVSSVKAQISALSGLSAGTLAVYCPADPVKLTAASTGAASYVWNRYAGTTATGPATLLTGNTANITDVPTTPGYYTYISTASNSDGCTSVVSDPAIIYVLPAPVAAIAANTTNPTGPVSYCINAVPAGASAVTFTATATTPSVTESFAYAYQWYKGTTAIAGATSATYTLTSPGDAVLGTNAYTVQVTLVIKACTPATSNGINVTVNDVPGKPVITITP